MGYQQVFETKRIGGALQYMYKIASCTVHAFSLTLMVKIDEAVAWNPVQLDETKHSTTARHIHDTDKAPAAQRHELHTPLICKCCASS